MACWPSWIKIEGSETFWINFGQEVTSSGEKIKGILILGESRRCGFHSHVFSALGADLIMPAEKFDLAPD